MKFKVIELLTQLKRGEIKREKKQKNKEKTDENSGHYVVASSRLPNAERWNAARSCQLEIILNLGLSYANLMENLNMLSCFSTFSLVL